MCLVFSSIFECCLAHFKFNKIVAVQCSDLGHLNRPVPCWTTCLTAELWGAIWSGASTQQHYKKKRKVVQLSGGWAGLVTTSLCGLCSLSASVAICCRLSLRPGDQQAAHVGFKLTAIQKEWVWDPWRTCTSGRSRGGAHRWGLGVVGEGWEWRVWRGFSDEFIGREGTESAIDERIALLRHWLFERISHVEARSMSLFGWLSYRRARGAGAGTCEVDCDKEGRWSGPQQVYQEGPVQARAQTGTQMLGVGLPGYVGRLQYLLLVVGRDV